MPRRCTAVSIVLCLAMLLVPSAGASSITSTHADSGGYAAPRIPEWLYRDDTGVLPRTGSIEHEASADATGALRVRARARVDDLPGACRVANQSVPYDQCAYPGSPATYEATINESFAFARASATRRAPVTQVGRYQATARLDDPDVLEGSVLAEPWRPPLSMPTSSGVFGGLTVWFLFDPDENCLGCKRKIESEEWSNVIVCRSGDAPACSFNPQVLLREWIQIPGPGTLTLSVQLDVLASAKGRSEAAGRIELAVQDLAIEFLG